MVEKKTLPKKTKEIQKKVSVWLDRYMRHENDTWSPEYQIWVIWSEIETLQSHLSTNPKDYPAKRALLRLVARRRQHLKYLKSNNIEKYEIVSQKIWLKV